VYGPGDSHHRLFPYVKRMADGRPAILLTEGQAEWRWTRGYVENVAAAVAHAAADDRAVGRVFNVGETAALSEAGWVRAVGRECGWGGEVAPVPPGLLPAGMAPDYDWSYHLATDTRLLCEQLAFVEPVARDEALRRTLAWEREHPPGEGQGGLFDYPAEDAALAQARRRS
jgi:nucleoside-diphosphate-sugar epimerase